MRVTQSMYYKSIYGQNNSQLNNKLFDVNKQIASGLKIQYSHEDVLTFADTMRLDDEITTLNQIQVSTESGIKVTKQTDSILNDFTNSLDRVKTLLIQATNDTQSATSRNAIAAELRGLEGHFKNLANTSINGKFLFAGTDFTTKPIAEDGTYLGNDQSMTALLGAGIRQEYNLSGAELFLGEKPLVQRKITTNIEQYNLSAKYPDFTDPTSDANGSNEPITEENTIRDLMGSLSDEPNGNSHFYIQGVKSSGESFAKQITMSDDQNVGELLTQIGNAFGNTSDLNLVNVSLDPLGMIVVEDKMHGSSKLDFHMIGAIDFDQTDGGDAADINSSLYGVAAGDIDHLSAGETDFSKIIKGTSSADNDKLYVKKFVQSSFNALPQTVNTISAEYSMDTPIAAGDTLTLGVTYADGTVLPAYTETYATSPIATYNALKAKIEAIGDFTVNVNDDTIKLNITQQGIENGATITSGLANDNVSVTVSSNVLDSSVPGNGSPVLYDRTMFTKDGSMLYSTTPQVLSSDNTFANNMTKLSEVADLSQGTPSGSLNNVSFTLQGNTTNGVAFEASIDLKSSTNGGSTFSLDGGVTNYTIFNMENPRTAVDADEITYRQFMDVVNMITTGTLPSVAGTHLHADGTPYTDAQEYDYAVESSTVSGQTFLSYDGKITFKDMHNTPTKANLSIYDSNSGNFSPTTLGKSSALTFNSNNALTISDAKTDFFKNLDHIISAVEENKMRPDGTNGDDLRNVGMQNALTMIDDIADHLNRSQSKVGAYSNALSTSLERTTLLEVSTKVLRSSVIDTDLAEASLQLTQLSLNYEAMLSTVGKVSRLSLVNYL